jgi:hypothetical protein
MGKGQDRRLPAVLVVGMKERMYQESCTRGSRSRKQIPTDPGSASAGLNGFVLSRSLPSHLLFLFGYRAHVQTGDCQGFSLFLFCVASFRGSKRRWRPCVGQSSHQTAALNAVEGPIGRSQGGVGGKVAGAKGGGNEQSVDMITETISMAGAYTASLLGKPRPGQLRVRAHNCYANDGLDRLQLELHDTSVSEEMSANDHGRYLYSFVGLLTGGQ